MAHDGGDASKKVWVGNLPAEATGEDLDAHFRQLSEPLSAVILKKGQGLITYDTAEEAEMAISAFNGSEIGGASIQTDTWTAKMPKGRDGKGATGKGGNKGAGKGGASCGGGCFGAKGGANGGWAAPAGKGGFGKGCGGFMFPPAMMYGMGAYGDAFAWGPPGAAANQWAEEPKKKQKWVEPAGPTQVHYISAPPQSALLSQGLPPDAPAVVYEKGDAALFSAHGVLKELLGDVAAEVQIIHDAEWEQYPEIGQALQAAIGEENCFAVAVCASRATWGIGVASGWKGREAAGKLAVALALAGQDPSTLKELCKNHPDFGTLCRQQGLIQGGPLAGARPAGKGVGGAAAPVMVGGGASGDVAPIYFITLDGDSKIKDAGLPAEAPAIFFTKAQKEYFSNSHSILSEFVEDVKEEVSFQDDPDGDIFPEVCAAAQAAGAEESGVCVASHAAQGAWGVGLAHGHDGRMRAAKLALGLALAQNHQKVEQFAMNYPEFGQMCANVGLIQAPKRRRKGGW